MVILLGRERLQLGTPLNSGGAGDFYAHPRIEHVGIKLYRDPKDCDPPRIEWLCSNPPPTLEEKGTPTFAWPMEPAYDDLTGNLVGFSMRRLRALPLQAIVNPSDRSSAVTRRFLWKVAISVLKRIHTLHLMNPSYIVGDVNFENYLVHRNGITTLLDIDSLHFILPGGHVFPCDRCVADLQPPELVRAAGRVLKRHQHQDAFSAFVVVHRLLRDGIHPFDANYVGAGTSLCKRERIEQGIWPDSLRHAEYRPRPGSIPFSSLPQDLQELFRQMFLDGIKDPSKRPNVTDLLTCLQLHQPAGARRSKIGYWTWKRALDPSNASPVVAGRLKTAVKNHKRKLLLVSAASILIAGGSQIDVARRKFQPAKLGSVDLDIGVRHQEQLSERSLDGSSHLPGRGKRDALATPELWRNAQAAIH